jgi:hypothetical protein
LKRIKKIRGIYPAIHAGNTLSIQNELDGFTRGASEINMNLNLILPWFERKRPPPQVSFRMLLSQIGVDVDGKKNFVLSDQEVCCDSPLKIMQAKTMSCGLDYVHS